MLVASICHPSTEPATFRTGSKAKDREKSHFPGCHAYFRRLPVELLLKYNNVGKIRPSECGVGLDRAGAPDDIKRTFLQLQKAFTISGTMTPLGPKDVEASALWRNHHYIPIAKYVNDLIPRFSAQLAEE